MKKILSLILFFCCFSLAAKEQYMIEVDPKFSPYIGGEDLLTVHETAEFIVNKIFSVPKEKKALYVLERLAEMVFIWQPLGDLEIVVQHEVFGHGYRIRDIGSSTIDVRSYSIKAPYPYGKGGGATMYSFNTNLTSFQEIAVSIAGVEASSILAGRLKMKWLTSLKLDPLKSTLYINAQQDLTSYVFSMNDSYLFVNDGHDIGSYIKWINNTYPSKTMKKDDLKEAVLFNFLDPYTYYSFFSFFYYIFTGKDFSIPMIKIKNIKYLPAFRVALAPFGVEYIFENFMSYKNRAIHSYIKAGEYVSSYFGAGIEYPEIYKTDKTSFGFKIDFFEQPKIYSKSGMTIFEDIQVGYSQEDLTKKRLGVSMYFMLNKRMGRSNFSSHVELGYKTKGFVPGESLSNAFNIRVGIVHGAF